MPARECGIACPPEPVVPPNSRNAAAVRESTAPAARFPGAQPEEVTSMKRVMSIALIVAAALFAMNALAQEKSESKSEKKPQTIKGEIVDMGCYTAHGAMGEKHKECATTCIAKGMPMGLLSGKTLYLLTLNHDNADPYNKCKDMAAAMVEVTGVVSERNGMKAIDVTDVKPAAAAAAK
jgi:hypothetical protein